MLAILASICIGLAAYAQGIHIRSADLVGSESEYLLDASFEVELSHTLDDALLRGIALYFVLDFELTHPRWWSFGVLDRTVAEFHQQHRLSYNALTRQYRLSFGNLHQNYATLQEALAVISRVRQRSVFGRDKVDPGDVYTASVRLRLDSSQLPKPLQINALASRDWNLASDWYRWTFRP